MVTDTLARLLPGGRSRRIVFVALVALMVTIAGCGGAGPSNNTTGTDGETTDGLDTGNETTDVTDNETTTGNETTDANATNDTNMSGMANIRVAHMSPDAPAVDVYVNNETFLEGVEFGTISDYTSVAPGEYNVTITEAGNQSNVVFADNLTVEEMDLTLTAIGELSENATEEFEVLVTEDGLEDGIPTDTMTDENASENNTTESNASANAAVRVIHASPDAGAVSIRVAGTDTFLAENVQYGDATDYVVVPAGDYSLEIVPADDTETVVSTVDVTLEAGAPYSAFAAGYVVPDDAPANTPFEVFLGVDAPGMTMGDDTTDDGNTSDDGNTTGTDEGNTSESLAGPSLFA